MLMANFSLIISKKKEQNYARNAMVLACSKQLMLEKKIHLTTHLTLMTRNKRIVTQT